MILIISIAIFTVLFTTLMIIYNRLVRANNVVKESVSLIDVQLKKRFELIPALVEAVKGYNIHETETLVRIVNQRTASGKTTQEMNENDRSLSGLIKNFRISIEAYPDLKANFQFEHLMKQLSVVEEELAMARRYYNGAVRDLNTKIEVFPTVLFAPILGFRKIGFYEIDENERFTPEIDLKKNA